MPSPVGHALGGVAIGLMGSEWGASGGRREYAAGSAPSALASPVGRAGLFAVLACLPDLDLLVGLHSTYTHSIGATVIVTALLLVWLRDPRLAIAGGAAYGSHVVLDWLGHDTAPPLGVMALWPVSSEHFMAPWPILGPVSRQYWLPGFLMHNVKVVLSELALFGACAGLVWWRRVVRRDRR